MLIETNRLILKTLRLYHAPQLYNIIKHPNFPKGNVHPAVTSFLYAYQAEASQLLCPQKNHILSVFLKNQKEMIGAALLTNRTETLEEGIQAEVDYFIALPHHGQGYAFEAMDALSKTVKMQYGLDSIYATADNRNIASQITNEKLGMKVIASQPMCLHYQGRI